MDDRSSVKTDMLPIDGCRSAPLGGSAPRGRGSARGRSYLTVARSGRHAHVKRTRGIKLDIAASDTAAGVAGTGACSSDQSPAGVTVGSSTSLVPSRGRSVTDRSTESSSTTGVCDRAFRAEVEAAVKQIETSYVERGLPAVARVCRRFGVDLSLLDCIAKDEFDAWAPDTIRVAKRSA